MSTEQASIAPKEDPPVDKATTRDARELPRTAASKMLWRLWWRRRFLVNKPKQLRAAVLIMGLVAALLLMINFLSYAVRTLETKTVTAAEPALREVMSDYDHNEMLLGILASVVVLAGVFVLTIFETHRTAGAALNIGRQLSRVADGRYDTRLTLRKGDNLRELEEPFNRMTQALRERAAEDAEILEGLAESVEHTGGSDGAKVAAELHKLAAQKRERAESL
jgi:methyl-accepting chemotaxis protein